MILSASSLIARESRSEWGAVFAVAVLSVLVVGTLAPRRSWAQEKSSSPWKAVTAFNDDLTKSASFKGIFRKTHKFAVNAGALYAIDVRSRSTRGGKNDFDPFIRLFDSHKRLLAEDDDSGEGTNARMLYLAPRSEEWTIEVANFFPDEVGEYECTIQGQHILSPPTSKERVYQGLLRKSDRIDRVRAGCRVHEIHLWLDAGKKYVIDLKSKDFDPFLRLEDLDRKELAFDDDSGGDLNARLTYSPSRTGTYLLLATTYVPATWGDYTLAVNSEAPPEAPR